MLVGSVWSPVGVAAFAAGCVGACLLVLSCVWPGPVLALLLAVAGFCWFPFPTLFIVHTQWAHACDAKFARSAANARAYGTQSQTESVQGTLQRACVLQASPACYNEPVTSAADHCIYSADHQQGTQNTTTNALSTSHTAALQHNVQHKLEKASHRQGQQPLIPSIGQTF